MAAPIDVPAATVTVTTVTHFHVSDFHAGCLPEREPHLTGDAPLALDVLAHLLSDWAESTDPGDPDDAVCAAAIAEIYCMCREQSHAAEQGDALARLEDGQSVCEHAGARVFEIAVCNELDCLNYCPAGDCRTVTDVNDTDIRCSCWGAC